VAAHTAAIGDLEAAIIRRMSGRVPGVSVAVVGRDGVRWMKGFGLADLPSRSPALPDTVYPWYSMTKVVTATAVLQLWERGRLALDEAVGRYYEPIARLQPSADAARITIRNLLNHSSGLANPVPVGWIHLADDPAPDPRAFLEALLAKHPKLQFAPGTRASYSNLGYLVLGEVIASVAGCSYQDCVRERILTPAGMTKTDFRHTPDMLSRAATGYQRRWSVMTPLLRMLVPRGVFGKPSGRFVSFNRFYLNGSAYGGLVGPVEDVARFLYAHLAGGRVNGWTMLSPESVGLMRTITSFGNKLDVGLGWFRPGVARHAERQFVEHLGGGGGFFNLMRLYSQAPLGIAIMGNATEYKLDGIAAAIADFFWTDARPV
jgi:CubicO group peptidase (beta-lactamase class C family)